ncbi:hypothetical protein E4U10_005047 [Claviceps purpurea]|nr:hypothetical protein E4U10_005047 [Claviceps purpurea]
MGIVRDSSEVTSQQAQRNKHHNQLKPIHSIYFTMQISTLVTLVVSMIAVATPVAAGRCCTASCGVCQKGSTCSANKDCHNSNYARCC